MRLWNEREWDSIVSAAKEERGLRLNLRSPKEPLVLRSAVEQRKIANSHARYLRWCAKEAMAARAISDPDPFVYQAYRRYVTKTEDGFLRSSMRYD